MAKHDVAKEEMDDLLPGERAAIEDGTDGDDGAVPEKIEAAAPADKGAEAEAEAKPKVEADEKAKADAEPKADAEAAAVAPAAAPAAAPAVPVARDADDFVEVPISKLLADNDEYQNKLAELGKKFDDSEEMSTAELLKEQQRLTAEYTDQAISSQNWARECHEFFVKHPEIASTSNRVLFNAFNQEVIRLANDEAHAGHAGRYYLAKAYEALEEAIPGFKKAPAPAGTKPAAPDLKARMERGPVPTSLAGIPAAAPADVGEGEFADLDMLATKDPLAYEHALAALPEDKARRYLEQV